MAFAMSEADVLHDANSVFQIGSVTKQFTSVIILKLQQQRKLSVKDKLSKYFPAYILMLIKSLSKICLTIHQAYTIIQMMATFMKNQRLSTLARKVFGI